MGEAAPEAVEQDRGPPIDERKRITPEAQSETEPEVGRRSGVRSLPWQVRRRVRHTDADRVKALVELSRFRIDAPQERFGVGDGRRACEDGERGQLRRQSAEEPSSDRAGEQ